MAYVSVTYSANTGILNLQWIQSVSHLKRFHSHHETSETPWQLQSYCCRQHQLATFLSLMMRLAVKLISVAFCLRSQGISWLHLSTTAHFYYDFWVDMLALKTKVAGLEILEFFHKKRNTFQFRNEQDIRSYQKLSVINHQKYSLALPHRNWSLFQWVTLTKRKRL